MILLCRCARANVLNATARERVLGRLAGSLRQVTVVEDLCGLCAARDPLLAALGAAEQVTVVACHARAVRWLLHFAGVDLPAEKLRVLDLRDQTGDEILAALSEDQQTTGEGSPGAQEQATHSDPSIAISRPHPAVQEGSGASWIPWFPVIDYDRCTNCRQCLGFCLFGVYVSDSDGKVRVANPSRCKTNCPACARTCPQVALMFPKYSEGPISGREVQPEDLSRGDLRVKPDRQRADIQAALRQRQQGLPGGGR
jgi:NAD-dependent dihydropyrimidine dehydrogenase PreA subunit